MTAERQGYGQQPVVIHANKSLSVRVPVALYVHEVNLTAMSKPKIIAYLKPSCGWSMGVRAVMKKYDLPYEDRDIINRPDQFEEMVQKTGQTKQPTLEINGRMLPDVSGDEVEAYMLANNLVTPNNRIPDAPTNQPCAHEMPAGAPMAFRR